MGEKSYPDSSDHERQEKLLKELSLKNKKTTKISTNVEDMTLDGLTSAIKANKEDWAITTTVKRDKDSTENHANHAMLEWFILAHTNWMMGHSGSSYAETAAALGLGPLGVMERVDMVHSENHVSTTFRRNYNKNGDFCSPVGAADPVHAEKCPNEKDSD